MNANQVIIIHHVIAIGSNLHLISFYYDGESFTFRISEHLYTVLRNHGIKTGQYLRYHKDGQ